MAHGRPASRQGRFVYHSDQPQNGTADELPSQSVFSFHGSDEIHQIHSNQVMHAEKLSLQKTHPGSASSRPMVAVHMFNIPSEKPIKDTETNYPWSGRSGDPCIPSPPPMPPSLHNVRQESARRRLIMGQRPPDRRSPKDLTSEKDAAEKNPKLLVRRRSSLSKYDILPAIGTSTEPSLGGSIGILATDRSDCFSEVVVRTSVDQDTVNFRSIQCADVDVNPCKGLGTVNKYSSSSSDCSASIKTTHESARHHRNMQSTDEVSFSPKHQNLSAKPLMDHASLSSAEAMMTSMDRSHTALSQHAMDSVLDPKQDGKILLGVKIPTDGSRHKQYFKHDDQLRCIVFYAEEVSGKDFSNYIIIVPSLKQRFTDLTQKIKDAGLEDKSVVHLEEMD